MGSMTCVDEQPASRRKHLLFIPHCTCGHITPLLRFAKGIARKGITVTFVSYEDRISRLTENDSSELQSLGIRFIGLENPNLNPGEVPESAAESAQMLEKAFEPLFEKLVGEKASGVSGLPTSIVSDMFLVWTQDVADKLEIPRYMFVPSGVAFARFMQGFTGCYAQGQIRISQSKNSLSFEGPLCMPGLPPLQYHELPTTVRYEPTSFLLRCQKMWQSAGILVNSFDALEEKPIESWRNPGHPGYEHTKVPQLYPIGPINPEIAPLPMMAIKGLQDSVKSSLHWLASQPRSSVIYVAFGSWVRLPLDHIRELALGLENSNQRFLWFLPKPDAGVEEVSIADLLPPGFQSRVGDRGCVCIGWAPQLQILAHSSTGGFLTHAGWNSCLESIGMGVPMIACPQKSEQHLNTRFLVDDLKIAEEIRTGTYNNLERKEVERAVRLLMVGPEGRDIRRRIAEFQRKSTAAVEGGGSQSRILQAFIGDISRR